MTTLDPPGAFRFSDYEVRPRSGELLRGGRRVPLPDKPFAVLTALIERPGELVTREELRERLWARDTFVDFDNNLNAAVRKLREALGDSASEPRFVETLPRRGYRLVVPVEPVRPRSPRDVRRRRSIGWGLLAGGLVLVALAAYWLARPATVRGATPPAGKIMLAVLPFANLSGDPGREFWSDGLTEELITQLGRLRPERLGVIARVSAMTYKDSDLRLDGIAAELGVSYVLEGSIRGGPRKIRVTAQLIQVADQSHLWAETYDVEPGDMLAVQADIARRVARSLSVELLPDDRAALARAATSVTEAYEEYLRGRHQWSRFDAEGYRAAIAHFERALELDPDYALAWAGLADAYNLLAFSGGTPAEAFPEARRAAERALELDAGLAEAHNALAFGRLYFEFDFAGAEESFRRAVEAAPNYAMAYHWQSGLFSALGRHDEAIAAVRHSLALDPVSLSVMSDLGWYLLFADRYEEGLAECERTLAREPGYGWAAACRRTALLLTGRYDRGVALAREAFAGEGVPESRLRVLDGLRGEEAAGALHRLELERALESVERGEGGWPLGLAMLHAQAGEPDGAFEWLERAWQARDGWLVFLRVDPRLDDHHGDPRFEELAERIGLR